MRSGNTFVEEARVVDVSVDEPEVVVYISVMRYNPWEKRTEYTWP